MPVVADEGLNLVRRGNQSGQIDCCATQKSDLVRGRVWLKLLLFQLRKNERVNSVVRPLLRLHGRYRGFLHRLQGPEAFLRVRKDVSLAGAARAVGDKS